MPKQILILALLLFAAVGMASAASAYAPTPSSGKDSGVSTEGPASNDVIGSVDGATDAAPVGGPVPDGAFTDVTAAPSPTGAALKVEATTVAGAMASAAFAGALFF